MKMQRDMNLLIPGLGLVLVLTAASFFIASSIAPMFLLISSTVLLIYAYQLHRSQFNNDYKTSTWQSGLKPLAPLVLVAVVLVLGYGAIAMTTTSFVGGGKGRIGRR